MKNLGILEVPDRLEPLRDLVGADNLGNVLVRPHEDIEALKRAVVEVHGARQSKVLFLLGKGGSGKTSLATGCPLFLTDLLRAPAIDAPRDYVLPLPELVRWIAENVPTERDRVVVVNVDGRENPAYSIDQIKGAVVNLNSFLRDNRNLLILWPVTAAGFAQTLVRGFDEVGGSSALASERIHSVVGIDQSRWLDVLELILNSTSTSLADAAVTREEVQALVHQEPTIGDFLAAVRRLVLARYDVGEVGKSLPRVTVVVSSLKDLRNPTRILQRTRDFLVDPERVLRNCRANIGDDWKRMAQSNAQHSFAFISSLLEVRLVHVSASAVVNACAQSSDQELADLVKKHYPKATPVNAANAMNSTSLVRSLKKQQDTGAGAARTSEEIASAYRAIQAKSSDSAWHRKINQAIVEVLMHSRVGVELPDLEFEKEPLRGRDSTKLLRVDAWFEPGERPQTLELTHILKAGEATIAKYVLEKTMAYARDYGLLD